MKIDFKISAKIKEAWVIYKNNLGLFFLILAFTFFLNSLGNKDGIILNTISIMLSLFLMYMIILFLLKVVDKKEFNPFSKKSIPSFKNLFNFISTYISLIIIILFSFVLLMIPFMVISLINIVISGWILIPIFLCVFACIFVVVYLSTRLIFACFISIDKNKGAKESIKESWKMTRGHFGFILWKTFLISIFAISGLFAFIIGVLVTYPISMILSVMLYKNFSKIKNESHTKIDDNTIEIENKVI